jgi:hypothetical protein
MQFSCCFFIKHLFGLAGVQLDYGSTVYKSVVFL